MTDPGSKNPIQLGACFDRSRFENPLPTVQLNRFHDSTNSGPANRTDLEYLSLNSLSVKVVTGCLQQSLWPPNFCESHIGKHHILVSSFNPHLILILEPQKIIIPFLILINPHSGTSKNPHSTSKPHSGT